MRVPISAPSASAAASVVWSISFGDLLTLLVCFFLVLTPWDKLAKANKTEAVQVVRKLPPQLEVVGTNFALSPLTQESLDPDLGKMLRQSSWGKRETSIVFKGEIPLFSYQLSEPSVSGLGELVETIRREMKEVITTRSTVVIRLCDSEVDVEEVVPLVGRIVKEVGVRESQLSISFPTTSCEETATMRPVTERLVGSISIVEERTRH